MKVLDKLYAVSRPVEVTTSYNEYINLAVSDKLSNYRLISSGEFLIHQNELSQLSDYVKSFIMSNPETLLIFEIVGGHCMFLIARTIYSKQFIVYGRSRGWMYGLGQIFQEDNCLGLMNTPILLVEGPKDRDVAKRYYKNSVALMSSTISTSQIEVLARLTNNIIIMLDNDEAGNRGTYKAIQKLKEYKMSYRVVKQYSGFKDVADILVCEDEFADNYYKVSINMAVKSFGGV